MLTFNVADFGATANDLTDDSAAIQAAIDAAFAAGGGTVIIPAGTFIVSGDPNNPSAGAVEVRSNVTLAGAGMGETILKLGDDFNARINGIVRTPVYESASNVEIRDLTIDGNRANNTGHQAGFISGVKESSTGRIHTGITLDKVEVMNCTSYGIDPHEITYDMVITNCVAHHNGYDGFTLDFVVDAVVENNLSYSNDRHGFNMTTSSTDVVLRNNISHSNGSTGLVIQRGDIFPDGQNDIDWPSRIQIIGGEYYGNASEGMLIKLSDEITIKGAKIHDNGRQGIRVEGATQTLIDGNTIFNNSQAGSNAYDEVNIRLRLDATVSPPRTYHSTGTTITNNDIYADGAIRSRYGIREEATNSAAGAPSGTVVSGNEVSGSLAGEYSIPPHTATEGDDVFAGTGGADAFAGKRGNDTYLVNHSGDTITEAPNAGTDGVVATLNYTLGANIENLALTGTAIRGTGNALDNRITGNSIANELEGLGGKDVLDGGAGADKMDGGDGDDTYHVDDAGDVIVEKDHLGQGGQDTVIASVSYTLAAEVEHLFLVGSANFDATGNTAANTLKGNSGNNTLNGLGGADRMEGGAGDDTYFVDHTGDAVVDAADSGVDTVFSTLTYTLGANLENLSLLGEAPRDGFGNEADNHITGNVGTNILRGGGGADTLDGGAGGDNLYGDAGSDVFVLRKGQLADDVIEDFVLGSDKINFLGFGPAATLVSLGSGNYKVVEGSYEEAFRVKGPAGVVVLGASDYGFNGVPEPTPNRAPQAAADGNAASTSEDTALVWAVPTGVDPDGDTALSYVLVAPLEGLVLDPGGSFTFTPPANASGSFNFSYQVRDSLGVLSAAQVFTITVQPVNDAPLASAVGNTASGKQDQLVSGQLPAGTDVEGDALTFLLQAPVAGLALMPSGSFTYTPAPGFSGETTFAYTVVDASGAASAPQVFTLTIEPKPPVSGLILGTSRADTLDGTLGDDVIDGKAGGDLMRGLAGNDTYHVDSSKDQVVEAANGGLDTVIATASFTLASNSEVEVLQGSGTSRLTLKGNDGANSVFGNGVDNTLYGYGGADTLDGGGGADGLYGGAGDDVFILRKGEAAGDILKDFAGKGANPGDTILFTGFGATATLTALGSGNFRISDGAATETFKIEGVSTLHASDYRFEGTTNPANRPPLAAESGNEASGSEDGVLVGRLPTAFDPDGDTLRFEAASTLAGLVLNADGTFRFTPAANANGPYGFDYRVVDSAGAMSAPQSFTFMVAAVADAPVAANGGNSATGKAGTIITGRLPAAVDPDAGAILSYELVSAVPGLTLRPDGSFDYAPAASFRGDISFSYRAVDETGLKSASTVFTVTVTDDAVPPGGQPIRGTSGADKLVGTIGDDVIDGLSGKDTMTGSTGNDVYYVDSSGDKVVELAGGGTDKVFTTATFAMDADAFVEIVEATGSSRVTLTGNSQANVLIGNAADNTLDGGNGNDLLSGGLGKDTLKGGGGADAFVFDTLLGAGNIDQIKDFSAATDRILLSTSIFNVADGILGSAHFIVGLQAADLDDRIIYDRSGGRLLFDADGSGAQAAVVFASISSGLNLTATHFVGLDETTSLETWLT